MEALMRLRIAAVAILGIVAISVISCSSSSGFMTYTDSTYGFSVSIPDSWETEPDGAVVFFRAPAPCGGLYPFGDVVAASTEGYSSVQAYYNETFEPFVESLIDYHLISNESLTIDGSPATKVIYTYTDAGYTFQEMACLLIDQKTLWVIIGSCEISCWNQYAGTFDTMAGSFQALY